MLQSRCLSHGRKLEANGKTSTRTASSTRSWPMFVHGLSWVRLCPRWRPQSWNQTRCIIYPGTTGAPLSTDSAASIPLTSSQSFAYVYGSFKPTRWELTAHYAFVRVEFMLNGIKRQWNRTKQYERFLGGSLLSVRTWY